MSTERSGRSGAESRRVAVAATSGRGDLDRGAGIKPSAIDMSGDPEKSWQASSVVMDHYQSRGDGTSGIPNCVRAGVIYLASDVVLSSL
jgi:hypothetical protein